MSSARELADCKRLAAQNPRDVAAQLALADVAQALGRTRIAKQALEAAWSLDPCLNDDLQRLMQLATLYQQGTQYTKSRHPLERALALAPPPQRAKVLELLGLAYGCGSPRNLKRAIDYYRQSLAQVEDLAVVGLLADALAAANEHEQSLALFRQGLEALKTDHHFATGIASDPPSAAAMSFLQRLVYAMPPTPRVNDSEWIALRDRLESRLGEIRRSPCPAVSWTAPIDLMPLVLPWENQQ